jgi:hypothetical protein
MRLLTLCSIIRTLLLILSHVTIPKSSNFRAAIRASLREHVLVVKYDVFSLLGRWEEAGVGQTRLYARIREHALLARHHIATYEIGRHFLASEDYHFTSVS